ncbi:hypothetical protein POPTR_004G048000v4 [Populus trichocarpa]|uniref:Bet v I/Major latex protein domain-containing protein n=1 Tax=Populus trichocarpa TaxID=3694 RepID=B9H2R4_POPTR|nr:uncharacterized protein LOC7456777 [Populus trichocarpa]KAI5590891.1 hypothetical protein BDE02_04G041100 [Populus trichocarpa]PNT39599.1 hypothetical protein POPTR_004G048000v4 [Populus trichocarpa]|eukprot:XP_002305778.1 uncharacterized protein LOC7456777 [Populus trichocarpa]
MAQIQFRTSRIATPLEHATAEQFYSVFNKPPYRIREICSQIGINIQSATEKSATIQFQTSDGAIKTVEGTVERSADDPSRTVRFLTSEANTVPDSVHELKLEVTDDSNPSAKWMVSNMHCSTPYDYLQLLVSVSKAVDNYFRQN